MMRSPFDCLAPLLLELVVEGEAGESLAQRAGDLADGARRPAHHPTEHTPHPDGQTLGKLTGTLHRTLEVVVLLCCSDQNMAE